MKSRFEGPDGHRLLVECLRQQRIIENNEELAERFASAGTVLEFAPGATVVAQDAADNDLFFLLSGEATILVNGRPIRTRTAGETVGEMALVDPAAPRSATVTAKKALTVLKVAEAEFALAAKKYPHIWRAIARVVSQRMRERNDLHRRPNERPLIFIGSSVEGLPVSKTLQVALKHSPFDLRPWTSGVFGPGGVPLDELQAQVNAADFAVFVFGPDDHVASRGENYQAPRDNVVFELGLFMGQLGRERAFIIREHGSDLKIPSDLLGVNQLTYVLRPGGDLAAALGPTCVELESAMNKRGVR